MGRKKKQDNEGVPICKEQCFGCIYGSLNTDSNNIQCTHLHPITELKDNVWLCYSYEGGEV